MNTKWSTVSFVKETPEIIQRFVAYHLNAGADRMVLFFDDPTDICINMLSHLERVTAVPCDDTFWRSIGGKPGMRHGRRQNSSTLHGYKMIPDGWVMNFDADEIFYTSNDSPAHFLQQFPEGANAVRLTSVEQIYLESDPEKLTFRLPVDKHTSREIYGDAASNLARNSGFVGHAEGKSIIRAGQKDIQLRQHWTIDAGKNKLPETIFKGGSEAALLHMNAHSYADWRSKLKFRLDTASLPGRFREHLQKCYDANDEAALERAYRSVQFLDGKQETGLMNIDKILQPQLNLENAIAKYFP